MAGAEPHIVRAFDSELEEIRALVSLLGGVAEAAIGDCVSALLVRDLALALQIIRDDRNVEEMAREIERQCVRTIALRAPVADDLRQILAAFKIATMIERMGDCARSIAEQVHLAESFESRGAFRLLQAMSLDVAAMVRAALDAFVRQDAAGAGSVCGGQERVHALGSALFRELLDGMTNNPAEIGGSLCLLLVAQNLERIGGHAISIGRAVHFSVTATPLDCCMPDSPGGEGRPSLG
jgi:phosphate transport system protein